MRMPSSRRHRFVKMRTEIVKQENMRAKGQTTAEAAPPTGLSKNNNTQPPRTVNLDYAGI
jgi:hypothetical protein